jgi:hypothetical protein
MKHTAILGSPLVFGTLRAHRQGSETTRFLDRRGEEKGVMNSAASAQQAAIWLIGGCSLHNLNPF